MREELLDLQELSLGRVLAPGEMIVIRCVRREGGRELTIEAAVARPACYRMTVIRGGRVLFSEGYDGHAAWYSDWNGAQPSESSHPDVEAYGKRMGCWLAGRRSLKEFIQIGVAVEFLPEARDATARAMPAFRVTLDSKMSKLIFLDRESGQVLVVRDEFAGQHDFQLFEVHTLDIQVVDGMRMPRHERIVDVDTGEAVAVLEWTSVRVGSLDADLLKCRPYA